MNQPFVVVVARQEAGEPVHAVLTGELALAPLRRGPEGGVGQRPDQHILHGSVVHRGLSCPAPSASARRSRAARPSRASEKTRRRSPPAPWGSAPPRTP